MVRRRKRAIRRWRMPTILLLTAFVLALGVTGWWTLTHWRPGRAQFPVQGIEADSDSGVIDWPGVRAIGARFAYLDATAGAFAHDPAFRRDLGDARTAGLKVGAVHRYDPCQPADRQAANFAAVVPQDPAMLAPAIDLTQTGDDCPVHVTDAGVERELMTFINQIEAHSGKPAVLKLSPQFERRYRLAAKIDRKLWLTRRMLQPDYAGRPWALWTANPAARTEVAEHALGWLAAQR